jgi:cell division protein FtsZ
MQWKHCKIIGVGGAGCNFIDACQTTAILSPRSGWSNELICVDASTEILHEFLVTFSAWLFDADSVILVAGVGGETGSRFMPMMARLAREAGAFATAAVIMPFDWEGDWRTGRASSALRQVEQEADLVRYFSNQELMNSLGDQVTQTEFYSIQEKYIASFIRDLLGKG